MAIMSVVGFIVGTVPLFPHIFKLCENQFDFGCLFWFRDNYLYLAYFTVVAPVTFLGSLLGLLRLKSKEVFIAWAKFAGVAFPLMTGYILYTFYTPPSGAFFGINDNEVYPIPLIILFVLTSFVIIAVKSWKLRRK